MLFAQERVGLNGKPFRMYKFLTMRTSAESETDTKDRRRKGTLVERLSELFLYYLRNRSFVFDLRIIVMTISSGLIKGMRTENEPY